MPFACKNSSGLHVTDASASLRVMAFSNKRAGAERSGKWVSVVSVRWRHFDSFRPQAKGMDRGQTRGVEWGGLARILWPRATVFEHTPVVIDRGRLTRSVANEPSPRSFP